MSACTLEDLLRLELEHLYSAEVQTLERLPRLLALVVGSPLKVTLELVRWEAEVQMLRLERAGQMLNTHLGGSVCKASRTFYREAERMTRSCAPGAILDSGLLVVFQRLSQREVAGYGAARTYAHLLGMPELAELLGESLDEQSATCQRLLQLSVAQGRERTAA